MTAAFLLALLASGCVPSPSAPPPRPAIRAAAADTVRDDLQRHFAAFDAIGTFVVYDAARGTTLRVGAERAARRYTPASTFKVYNALVALDAGTVPDVDSVFAWDGVDRERPEWNRDHSLRTGMRVSAVWLYQEVARRNGEARFAEAMRRVPYGNSDRSCGLDRFWLDGCLRISADEQVRWLDRLRQGALPFRAEAQAAVREIVLLEESDGVSLYGKTGWGGYDDLSGRTPVGWLVGWVERPEGAYVYALNLEPRPGATHFDMMRARRGVLDALLADLRLRSAAEGIGAVQRPPPHPVRRASGAPPDEWIARDKALHLGASFLLTLSAQYVLVSKAGASEERALPVSATTALAFGVAKEVWDSRRSVGPLFSLRDLAADALGVALAAGLILW